MSSLVDAPRPARVFVGLSVAPEIARELAALAASLEQPAVRLVAPSDIHLTLVPPWNEATIPDAVEKLRRAAGRCRSFQLTFRHVGYGPHPGRPRLLWVDCAATGEIAALRAALLQAYGQTDERPFRPHVTLARIRARGVAVARKNPVDRDVLFIQDVKSVELFQSPPAGERGYRVLASLQLAEAARPGSNT